MLNELGQYLDLAINNPDVRVIVVTGEGGAFCSGLDLAVVDPDHDDLGVLLEERYRPIIERLAECPKVTIAALNGPAAGAGASLMMACDLVIAMETAFIQLAFVNIGLIPDAGATWFLPRMIGTKSALAWALIGDRISAHDARASGLVYDVYPDVDFAAESSALARRVALKSPTACRSIKEALRASLTNDLATQFSIEEKAQSELGRSVDFKSAVETFLKKR